MCVFGAFFGRRGDTGFSGPVLGASSGVVGFNVAMFLRPVCEVFRANLPCTGLGCSAALAALLAVGGLHYTKPSRGVSPACRSLMSCNSPRLVARRCAPCASAEPHVVQFPPFGGQAMRALRKRGASCRAIPPIGGGEAATHSGVVPKVQTTSAKNVENGVSWARWTTFWAHRCLARCTCSRVSPLFRASTRYVARELLDTHVNPSTCTWAEPPTHISSASRAGERAQQVIGPTCAVTGSRVTTTTTRSNVARNSPEDVSGFEIGSLIFRGFQAVCE